MVGKVSDCLLGECVIVNDFFGNLLISLRVNVDGSFQAPDRIVKAGELGDYILGFVSSIDPEDAANKMDSVLGP